MQELHIKSATVVKTISPKAAATENLGGKKAANLFSFGSCSL